MEEIRFVAAKRKLESLIISSMKESKLTDIERNSLNKLSVLLEKYTYENRLQFKGIITRTIIDSLELPYDLAEKFIDFDNGIR